MDGGATSGNVAMKEVAGVYKMLPQLITTVLMNKLEWYLPNGWALWLIILNLVTRLGIKA